MNTIDQLVEKLNSANDFRDKACVDTRQLVTIAYNDINQFKEQLEGLFEVNVLNFSTWERKRDKMTSRIMSKIKK